MSSSSSSQAPEPASSDSLDTTLGLGTEVGRSTVASPTYSSTQGLSNPTLASSDSSRPESPPLTASVRPHPPPDPPPLLPPEGCRGPASATALPRHRPTVGGSTAEESLQSTRATLEFPAPSGGPATVATLSPHVQPPGGTAQARAPPTSGSTQPLQGPDSQLLQLELQFKQLHQEQLQQQHEQTVSQNQMMVMMQNLLTRMNAAPTAPISRPVTPPPLAERPGPAVAAPAPNPWALPQAPTERPVGTGGCRLCASHINHICLHSTHSECQLNPGAPAVPQLYGRLFQNLERKM